jgi:hypothetical protein
MTDRRPSNQSKTSSPLQVPPPVIAARGHVVIGRGFLPDHAVTIRLAHTADDVIDYLGYASDSSGRLHASLPEGAAGGTCHVAATDHRTDLDDSCGLLWSNSVAVRASDD